ncbi:hypothetical protein H6G17_28450 [Chroococcidiopsis sp. FACHB-1243]|uniref:hypothetical protein n=1 Tax=Chroococcidiopsis sp. [FACHB-1243] TaxID=2692781 RepID=UPI00177EDEA0|nr:hypothetical protein [Chroococcidiopsis sp. [FACHB-1243]]MBD2309388.1 hypothetical protein [Chroococcidiopsis sp. [FACHB-1243]]
MESKRYNAAWSKIGNSSGFRLENSFFKDNPQFAGVTGEVQVVSSNTLLVRLETSADQEQEKDELMLASFLDFLMENALRNPKEEIEIYTEEMAAEDEELLAGVDLDS